jgi:hypothetical protein
LIVSTPECRLFMIVIYLNKSLLNINEIKGHSFLYVIVNIQRFVPVYSSGVECVLNAHQILMGICVNNMNNTVLSERLECSLEVYII